MQNVKEYLNSYLKLKDQYDFLEYKKDGVSSPSLTNEAKSTVPKPKYVNEIMKQNEIVEQMKDIEQFIYDNFYGQQATFIWLKYIKGKHLKEISAECDVSISYVSKEIHKAITLYERYDNSLIP